MSHIYNDTALEGIFSNPALIAKAREWLALASPYSQVSAMSNGFVTATV